MLGAAVIIALNMAGQFIGFHIPLNIVSSFSTGILGLPGLILLFVINTIL
jgi:pro-sigmaK processing inhibitor BofA